MSTEQVDSHEAKDRTDNRKSPYSEAFKKFIVSGWAPYSETPPERLAAADWTPARWTSLREAFPGATLVVPAGPYKVRSNDCDYRFRPHSTFAWVTGLGEDREPDAVAVVSPDDVCLYFRPRCPRTDEEFYASSRYGEMWVGQRDSLEEMAARVGFPCRDLRQLRDDLSGVAGLRVVRESDPEITAMIDELRGGQAQDADAELFRTLSELRLVKDPWEIDQLRAAVAATKAGFDDLIRSIPRARGHWRGERVLEGAFGAKAREEGNGLGYDTIAAAGNHANTLHWINNDGAVEPGQLVLVDAGVEVDSLYTADVTRTIPVDGRFTEAQRRIYQAVLDAADAAFARAGTPGCRFKDVHAAAMEVIAARLEEWGMLPEGVSAADSLAPEGQYHRRWMVHGTSHHLGLDVHDCAQARREMYMEAELKPGMCFTIEPGLYFREDDLLVPAEMRGTGVRIEDDVVVREDGSVERLTQDVPRTVEEVEAWVSGLIAN